MEAKAIAELLEEPEFQVPRVRLPPRPAPPASLNGEASLRHLVAAPCRWGTSPFRQLAHRTSQHHRWQALGVPAWVAVSFKDGAHLTSGEPLADLGAAIFTPGPSGAPRGGGLLAAVGLNCGPPEHAAAALQTLAAAARAAGAAAPPALVCYPNKGEAWDVERRAWVADTALPDDDFACACRAWRDAGARFIGGCCRTTPETITGIRASLRRGRSMM
jgi:S-methylmethionine-dependent homocysteine/selenocysteine methylase